MAKTELAASKGKETLKSFVKGKDGPRSKPAGDGKGESSDVEDVEDETEDVAEDEHQFGSDDENDDTNSNDDVEMEETTRMKTTAVDKKGSPADSNLPPLSNIPSIFTDLVSRVPDINKVIKLVSGRKLRVATMCSGTESPLLALELIQASIEELHGAKLDIEHVFSCEIEPFKQAYIERNFSPPILFRDICELGEDEA